MGTLNNIKFLRYFTGIPGILYAADANSQIVVHDFVEPITGGLHETVDIDFNDDGFDELHFRMYSFLDLLSYGSNANFFCMLTVDAGAGAIVCDSEVVHSIVSGHPYPAQLVYDFLISTSQYFVRDNDNFVLAKVKVFDDCGVYGIAGSWHPSTDTAYMGVKFVIDQYIHFGWVRLRVDMQERKYEIFSYAYNAMPKSFIMAGQINQITHELQAVQQGNQVLVSAPDYIMGKEMTMVVTNIAGQIFLNNQIIVENPITLDMLGMEAGVYLITMFNAENRCSAKVLYINTGKK